MKIKKTLNVKRIINGSLIATIWLLIGIMVGITICPRYDFSSCLDLAEHDRLMVSEGGVITDLAIQTMNGSNYSYNKSLSKCLELSR